jgi:hypothetical protein
MITYAPRRPEMRKRLKTPKYLKQNKLHSYLSLLSRIGIPAAFNRIRPEQETTTIAKTYLPRFELPIWRAATVTRLAQHPLRGQEVSGRFDIDESLSLCCGTGPVDRFSRPPLPFTEVRMRAQDDKKMADTPCTKPKANSLRRRHSHRPGIRLALRC